MTDPTPSTTAPNASPDRRIPEAKTAPSRGFSIVWLIPVVALLVGAWLGARAVRERGPEITIRFATADGLTAGKTKIKYREVEMGVVEKIELSQDLSHVIAHARMVSGRERLLTDRTRFWVVRANVSAAGISGLSTIFSGAYIAMDPAPGGDPRYEFQGLAGAPIVTAADPGRRFVLRGKALGSLQVGSPVYYRQFEVGEVLRTTLASGGDHVDVDVFIHAPHHERVRQSTHFWNASGIDIEADADGIRVDTQSFAAILIGGVAFDTANDTDISLPSATAVFPLYPSRQASLTDRYPLKARYLAFFSGSVKGLSAGAPVELRGIKVGQVVDVHLEFDAKKLEFRAPVVLEIEPQRFQVAEGSASIGTAPIERLVERGLRAQLKTGNLLTGKLLVDLDIHPEAAPATVLHTGKYPELPTMPTPLDELAATVTRMVGKIDRMPLEQVGTDLVAALVALRATLEDAGRLTTSLRQEVVPAATRAMDKAELALASVGELAGDDSAVRHDLQRLLVEVTEAAKAIGRLADHLDRNPENLLRGKRGSP